MHSRHTRDRRAAAQADTEPAFDLIPRKGQTPERAPRPLRYDYRAGHVIAGKYELLHLLGRGGMSAVWAVQNLVLDAQFALKLILHDDADEYAAERMLREARSVARIDHPGIIRMFDFGVTEHGDPFPVMELLSGTSLRERLRESGPLTPIDAVRFLLPVAEALSVAHAHGIVHRDLKPDNIVCVQVEGGRLQPKIIDFGIARQLDQESARLTMAGMVVGSPEYMSPEQALGLFDVDYRTDVWSFSIVLYEALTGRTPFWSAGDPVSVLRAIVDGDVAPMAMFGVHDRELWSIVSRGLVKTLEGRWQDMRAYGQALARWLVHKGVEDDICMQSVRMVWLGAASASAPPVAMDAGDVEAATRARLAALNESYDVPKRSLFRTAAGIVAALSTLAFIAYAGFRFAHSGASAPKSPAPVERAMPAPPEPPVTPAQAPVTSSQPSVAPALEPSMPPAPSEAERPSPARAETTPPPARAPDGERRSKSASRSKKSVPAKPPPPALSLPEPEPPGTTVLPLVRSPPDFDAKPSDDPYGESEPPPDSSSDNPY